METIMVIKGEKGVGRVEIFGYLKIGLRDEPFEFKGTISGGLLSPAPAPPSPAKPVIEAQPQAPAVLGPEELPRTAQGKLCVSCGQRQGSRRLVKGLTSERAVPRVLCTECVTDMFKAGKVVSIENM